MKFRTGMFRAGVSLVALAVALLINLGCGARDTGGDKAPLGPKADEKAAAAAAKEKKIAEARAKLSPEDRALVEAQDYCPIMPKQKLGSMGVPMKLTIKGEPVFICCKGCRTSAEEEPDETLAAVAALKAKKK